MLPSVAHGVISLNCPIRFFAPGKGPVAGRAGAASVIMNTARRSSVRTQAHGKNCVSGNDIAGPRDLRRMLNNAR